MEPEQTDRMPGGGPVVNPYPHRFRMKPCSGSPPVKSRAEERTADPGERFRFDPARTVIQMMAAQNLALAAVYAGMWAAGLIPRPTLVMLAIGGGQVVGGAVLFWLTFRRCGVRVGPAGLAFEAPLMPARRVAWDDIDSVRPRQVGVVPQLVLRGPGVQLALPFTLADPDGFAEAVAHHAGDDHPLTVAVWERLAAG